MMGRYYAVMKLNKWEEVGLEQVGSLRLPLKTSMAPPGDGSVGFIEVFDTREAANKATDDESLVSIVQTLETP